MRTFRTILFLVFSLFLLQNAWGDALTFVSGERLDQQTPWTVKLLSVDAQSGLAEFDFRVNGGWQRETIHISRILCLYFSYVPPTNKTIQLRATVREDIGGNLQNPRKLYVSEEFHLRYPNLPYVGAGKGLYVRGTILSFRTDDGVFTIRCLDKDGKSLTIEGVLDFMITGWVR